MILFEIPGALYFNPNMDGIGLHVFNNDKGPAHKPSYTSRGLVAAYNLGTK